MKTLKLSCAHALFKYLIAQKIIIDGKKEPLFPGAFGIYGHGNVACLGQAMEEFQNDLPGYMWDEGVKAVMGALKAAHEEHLERNTPSKLMQLHLEHNMIDSEGAAAIAALLSQPGLRLEQLVLHSNAIGPQGAYSLALPLVKNSTLRSLDLHGNGH